MILIFDRIRGIATNTVINSANQLSSDRERMSQGLEQLTTACLELEKLRAQWQLVRNRHSTMLRLVDELTTL